MAFFITQLCIIMLHNCVLLFCNIQRVRELESRDRERELQIAFAKKLVEIRNREVKRPDDIKRFKK